MTNDPHLGQPVETAGATLEQARAAAIFLHGRGASARSILSFAREFEHPDIAYLAPQAAGYTWYPYSFLAPLSQNEPWLTSALHTVNRVRQRIEEHDIPAERILIFGFSQGACLASEYAARRARRYGGVVALSGGLIGTGQKPDVDPPVDKRFDYEGDLAGTPVFFGCSDVDPHIPVERVHDSAEAMKRLGGRVTKRIYEGMGHTVNEEELTFVREMLSALISP